MSDTESADGWRRVNGFDLPLHPLQVASWVVFGANMLMFSIFCLPLVEDLGAQAMCSVIFSISVVGVLVNTFWATQRDPVDRNVLETLRQDVNQSEMPYCTRCNSHVFPRSKHCKLCCKCVDIFDHHCKWMNTCVGKDNYLYFILSITCLAVMAAVQVGVSAYLLYENVAGDEVADRSNRVFGFFDSKSLSALFAFMLAINVAILYLDTQLVILHIYLKRRDLTTYEYIMMKRSQQEISGMPQRDLRVTTSSKYEVCETGDRTYPPSQTFSPQGRSLKHGIRTLPAFLDWFVYQRKRSARRRNHTEKKDTGRVVAQTVHVDVVMAKEHDHLEQSALPERNNLSNANDKVS